MKAAIYTRVSSDRQVDGFSLEAQHDALISEINRRGWELYDFYSDPGESGGNLKRPGVQRLIEDMKAKKFDALIVHKLDRLTRNIGDLYYLIDLINKLDIQLIINGYSEQIDTKSAMGKIFIYMSGIFAEIFLDNLREEIYKGQSKRASKGLRNNPVSPFGYISGEDLKLSINEDEAQIVKEIFEMRLKGWGRNKIARVLNRDEKWSRTGIQWSEKVVGGVLSNIAYTGAVSWKRKEDPEESRITVPNMHEPIIDMESFLEVQDIKQRVAEGLMNTSPYDYPFSTITKCAICGRSFNGKVAAKYKGKIYRGYRCNGVGRANSDCTSSEIAETKLTAIILEHMKFSIDKNLDVNRPLDTPSIDVEKERKRIEKQISDSKDRRKKWAKAMGNGKMDYETYSELVDEDQDKIIELQKELDQLPEKNSRSKLTAKDWTEKLTQLHEEWPNMDNMERKHVIQGIFKRIVIGKVNDEWNVLGREFNN